MRSIQWRQHRRSPTMLALARNPRPNRPRAWAPAPGAARRFAGGDQSMALIDYRKLLPPLGACPDPRRARRLGQRCRPPRTDDPLRTLWPRRRALRPCRPGTLLRLSDARQGLRLNLCAPHRGPSRGHAMRLYKCHAPSEHIETHIVRTVATRRSSTRPFGRFKICRRVPDRGGPGV